MNAVNTMLKETSNSFAASINKSFFKDQVSFYASIGQEHFDAESGEITTDTNVVYQRFAQGRIISIG